MEFCIYELVQGRSGVLVSHENAESATAALRLCYGYWYPTQPMLVWNDGRLLHLDTDVEYIAVSTDEVQAAKLSGLPMPGEVFLLDDVPVHIIGYNFERDDACGLPLLKLRTPNNGECQCALSRLVRMPAEAADV